MTQDEARRLIIGEWDEWWPEHKRDNKSFEERDALPFFGQLPQNLLDFRCSGDRWQKVKIWIRDHQEMKDRLR